MQIELNLGNASYTLLHRAGLAGLYMTLEQLKDEKVTTPYGLNWELTPRQIKLAWEENDQGVLEWLLREAFQLNNGIIALRGLDSKTMRKDAQVMVHQGILGTFLQHTSTHKSAGVEQVSFKLEDDKPEILVSYKVLEKYAYQEFASNICDKNGNLLDKPISVTGWLNPGAVVRHIAFSSDTSFEESPENAFVLLFASVACYYYILRSKLRDKRAQYALVIPEIIELESYSKYRRLDQMRYASYQDFHKSGLGDAGLKFLTYETTTEIAEKFGLSSCQVITLGTVAWATQQKTRTDLYIVKADTEVCHNYKISCDCLPDKVVAGKENGFIASSFARELIAENLVRNRPWYVGIGGKVNSNELFEKLTYERGGLHQMVEKAQFEQRDKLFVKACHEAIYYRRGKIYKQANNKGEIPNFDRENIKIRTGLNRCKSADAFREFITDFWSRAGQLPTLQANWDDLMDLVMQEKEWKKARDLALLALASYKGKAKNGNNEDEEDLETSEEIEVNDDDINLNDYYD